MEGAVRAAIQTDVITTVRAAGAEGEGIAVTERAAQESPAVRAPPIAARVWYPARRCIIVVRRIMPVDKRAPSITVLRKSSARALQPAVKISQHGCPAKQQESVI